jgi:predicted AAA+ superfamily ATPase
VYQRSVNIEETMKKRSILFLGPRQTGKSTLLRNLFPSALYINLLEGKTYFPLQNSSSFLQELVEMHLKKAGTPIVIIDEIQKIPELFDEVHNLIETYKELRFILTGSSARKLKRVGVNLLGGRAQLIRLYPITSHEIQTDRECSAKEYTSLLSTGGLPSILNSLEPFQELENYVGLYLREEIAAEALTRSVGSFARFLTTAASTNGEQVNYTSVSRDAQVPHRTIIEYYQILEDTFLGTLLPPFSGTKNRKAVTIPKFYFFDIGVANSLLGREHIKFGTPDYGRVLEHLVFCELTAWNSYHNAGYSLHYWRTGSKLEVDFILQHKNGSLIGIEVKGSGKVTPQDYKGLPV